MLDTRSPEWLSRLQGNGPRLVSLALAALIAVELARIGISLLSGGPVKSPQPVLSNAATRNPHAGVDVQAVTAAHLFGVAVLDPASQDPANAPPSTANLVLAGTIATQDPKHGVAIISDGGPSKVYSVGDNIGGASLALGVSRPRDPRSGRCPRNPAAAPLAGSRHACGADRASPRRRSAHRRGGRQHSPHGATRSGHSRSSDAHGPLVRQRRRQAAWLSRLSRPKSC